MQRSRTAALLGTIILATTSLAAQPGRISWLPPVDVTGPSDVVITGELCIAANLGPETCEQVINGVHFMADRGHWTRKIMVRGGPVVRGVFHWPDLTSGGFTLKMPFDRAAGMGNNPVVTDASYRTALASAKHKSPAYPSTINCSIEGLIPGRTYLIQIWAANASNGRTTEWDDGQGGREGNGGVFLTTTTAAKGQYAIGTFTADASGLQNFTNFQQNVDPTQTPPLRDTWGSCAMIQIRDVSNVGGDPRATYYGLGTKGTNTQPLLGGSNCSPYLALSGHPKVGSQVTLSVDNSQDAAAAAMIVLGIQPINVPYLGGTLLVSPLLVRPLTIPQPATPYTHDHELQLTWTLPNSTGTIFAQVLQQDPGAAGGIAFTPGMRIDIRN